MVERQGSQSYLKYAPETAWGDGTTPSRSLPVKSASFKPVDIMKPRASELRASRFPQKPLSGVKWTPTSFLMNAYPEDVGYMLSMMHGDASSSGVEAGVYDNVFEPGLTVPNSLSCEFSIGGANPMMVAGVKANQIVWALGIADEAQMLSLAVSGGGKFGTEGSPTAFSDPTTQPFQMDECVLTWGGPTIYAESLTWTEINGLVLPNHKISGGTEMREPPINGQFSLKGSFVLDYEDMGNFDNYRNLTDMAITATFTTGQTIGAASVYTLTVTMPACKILTNPLPEPSGTDIQKETIEFEAFAGTVGASEVPVSYTLRCTTDFS